MEVLSRVIKFYHCISLNKKSGQFSENKHTIIKFYMYMTKTMIPMCMEFGDHWVECQGDHKHKAWSRESPFFIGGNGKIMLIS